MELTQLLNSVNVIQVIGEVQRKDVSSIEYDSRKVKRNSVFVAIKGFNVDGHKFILDAINSGAIAIVVEDDSIPDEIFRHRKTAKILVKSSRAALSEISNSFFKEPSKKLKLIGITGTNGKTTTSFYIKNILEVSGNKTGLIGTIANFIGNEKTVSSLTTPEANDLNELLLKMVSEGNQFGVMEVSSHSLYLKRVNLLQFQAAVFTNITSDHLDFHKSFENYLEAKKILFDSLSSDAIAVYNSDDPNSIAVIKNSRAKQYSYGTASGSDFFLKDIQYDLSGTRFIVQYKSKEYYASTSLVGDFNAYNAAAAFAVTVLLGINEDEAINGIKNTPQVPGRFEVIGSGNKKAIIDYSHTADSLDKALTALNRIVKDENPIYTVFGCGGNRDKSKRPIMGEIASRLSKHVIITSDNPRFENPFEIIDHIRLGISKNNYEIIENREEAIKSAILNSEGNAVIMIAGKGHENYQEINGERNHFSDKEIAKKYL
jgi:UDP-N-acetylmuramoyl-L-alanyl-D-glutamate--2,6-diaminopimelate ligase